jgi:Clostripain family
MKKPWTVMVYMAADNESVEDFFADLEPEALRDLDEMKSVGSNDDLDIVVQLDRKTPRHAERLQVWPGRTTQLATADQPINTGSPFELQDFVSWVQQNFPASNYMLVLWGHSLRYAFGYDHRDALTVAELRTALPRTRPQQLEIIGFDACGMSAIETAYELRKHAKYMVASEIGMPLPGWPYSRVLRAIAETPDISPEDLGKAIVREFVAEYPDKTVALTMLDLASLDSNGVVPALKELARALALAVGGDPVQREMILRLFRDACVPTGEPLVDLREVCVNLGQSAVDQQVQQAASAMLARLATGAGTVVDHRSNGRDADDLCGVSAYAPHVGRVEDSWLGIYDQLDLSRKTYWPEVVRFLAYAD